MPFARQPFRAWIVLTGDGTPWRGYTQAVTAYRESSQADRVADLFRQSACTIGLGNLTVAEVEIRPIERPPT